MTVVGWRDRSAVIGRGRRAQRRAYRMRVVEVGMRTRIAR